MKRLARLAWLLLLLPAVALAADPEPEPLGGYLSIGVGYDNNEGFLAGASIGNRDMFGLRGLDTSLAARISAAQQKFDYHLDVALPSMDPYFVGLHIYSHGQGMFDGEHALQGSQTGGTLELGGRLGKGWRLSGGLRMEGLSMQNGHLLLGSGLNLPPDRWEATRLYVAPFVRVAYDAGQGDDPNTRLPMGLRLHALLEHSSRWSGSAMDMTRLEAGLSHGLRLPAGMVLQSSLRAGMQLARPGEVPFFSRYRLSGPLAGDSALPMVAPGWRVNGDEISLGGTGILHCSVELHAPIVKGILYGFVGMEAGALYHPDLAHAAAASIGGAGLVGLRWLSPIGPIRAGVALPLGPGKDQAYEPGFLFSLGGRF